MSLFVSGIEKRPLTSEASNSPRGTTPRTRTSSRTALNEPSAGTDLEYDGVLAKNAVPAPQRSGKKRRATLGGQSTSHNLRRDCNQYLRTDINGPADLPASLPSTPTLTPPVAPAGPAFPYTRTQSLSPHIAPSVPSSGQGFSTTTQFFAPRTTGLSGVTMQAHSERTSSPVHKTPPPASSHPNPVPNHHYHLGPSPGSSSFSTNTNFGHGQVVQPGVTRLEIGASKTRLTAAPLHTHPKPPTVVVQEWSGQGAQNQNTERSGAGGLEPTSEQHPQQPSTISIGSPSSGWYSTSPSSSSASNSPVSPLVIAPTLESPAPVSAANHPSFMPSTSTSPSSSPPATAHNTSSAHTSPSSSPAKASSSPGPRVVFNTHSVSRSPTRSAPSSRVLQRPHPVHAYSTSTSLTTAFTANGARTIVPTRPTHPGPPSQSHSRSYSQSQSHSHSRNPSYGQVINITATPPRSRSTSRTRENAIVRRQALAAQERILASRDTNNSSPVAQNQTSGQGQPQPQPPQQHTRTRTRSTSMSRAPRGYVPGYDWTGAKEESSMMSMMGRLGVGSSPSTAGVSSPSSTSSTPTTSPKPPASAPGALTSGHSLRGIASVTVTPPNRSPASTPNSSISKSRNFSMKRPSTANSVMGLHPGSASLAIGPRPTTSSGLMSIGGSAMSQSSSVGRPGGLIRKQPSLPILKSYGLGIGVASGSGASRGYGAPSTTSSSSRGLAIGPGSRPTPGSSFGGDMGSSDKSDLGLLQKTSLQSLRSHAQGHPYVHTQGGSWTPPSLSRKSSLTPVTGFSPHLNISSASSNSLEPSLNRKLSLPGLVGLPPATAGPTTLPTTPTIPRKGSLQNILGFASAPSSPPPTQTHSQHYQSTPPQQYQHYQFTPPSHQSTPSKSRPTPLHLIGLRPSSSASSLRGKGKEREVEVLDMVLDISPAAARELMLSAGDTTPLSNTTPIATHPPYPTPQPLQSNPSSSSSAPNQHPVELDLLSRDSDSLKRRNLVDYEYDDSEYEELHSHPVLPDTESSHYSLASTDDKSSVADRDSATYESFNFNDLAAINIELGGELGVGGGGWKAPSSLAYGRDEMDAGPSGHLDATKKRRKKKRRKGGDGDDLPLTFARPPTADGVGPAGASGEDSDDGDLTEFDISAPATPHVVGFGDVLGQPSTSTAHQQAKRKRSKGGMMGIAEFLTRENELLEEKAQATSLATRSAGLLVPHPYASAHARAQAVEPASPSTGQGLPPLEFKRRKGKGLVGLEFDSEESLSTGSDGSEASEEEVEASVELSSRQDHGSAINLDAGAAGPSSSSNDLHPYRAEGAQPGRFHFQDDDSGEYSSETESLFESRKLREGKVYGFGGYNPRSASENSPFPLAYTWDDSSGSSLARGYADEEAGGAVKIAANSDLPASASAGPSGSRHAGDGDPPSPKDAEGRHVRRPSKKKRPIKAPGPVDYIEVYVDNQDASAWSRSPSPIKYARRRSGSDGDDEVLGGEVSDEDEFAISPRRRRGRGRGRGRERGGDPVDEEERRGRRGNPSMQQMLDKDLDKSRRSMAKMGGLAFGLGKGKEKEKGKATQQQLPDTASEESSSLSLSAGVGSLLKLKRNIPGTLVNVNASYSSTGTGPGQPLMQHPASAPLKNRFLPLKSSGSMRGAKSKGKEKERMWTEDELLFSSFARGKQSSRPPATAPGYLRDPLYLDLDFKKVGSPSSDKRHSPGHRARYSTRKSVDAITSNMSTASAPFSHQHRSPSSPSFPTTFMRRKSLDGKEEKDKWGGWETDGPYPHLHAHLYSSAARKKKRRSHEGEPKPDPGKKKTPKRPSTAGAAPAGPSALNRGNSFNAFMTFAIKRPKTTAGEKSARAGPSQLQRPTYRSQSGRSSPVGLSQDENSKTPIQMVSPTETEKPRSPFPPSSRQRKGKEVDDATDAGHQVITGGTHSPSPIRYAKRSSLDEGDTSDRGDFDDDDDLDDLDQIGLQRARRRRGGPGIAFAGPKLAARRPLDGSESDQRGRTLDRISLGIGLGVKKQKKREEQWESGPPSSSDVPDKSSTHGSSSGVGGSAEGPLGLSLGLGKGKGKDKEREREKALAKEREKERQREKQREKEREKQRREQEKELKQQKKLGRSFSATVLMSGGKVDEVYEDF